jgi:hypothetical protein
MATWSPQSDGEYNEHTAEIDGVELVVWSERDGTRWECSLDGEVFPLEATSLEGAQQEAEALLTE